jgi:hypothetical protein
MLQLETQRPPSAAKDVTVNAPSQKGWRAITDVEEMKHAIVD